MSVLDASAVLALLQKEPGWEVVERSLDSAATMSAVNLAEVHSSVMDRGIDTAATIARLLAMGMQVMPFDEHDAQVVGALRPRTREFGLSLADRACLALALRLGHPVLATDKALADADVGVDVVLIR